MSPCSYRHGDLGASGSRLVDRVTKTPGVAGSSSLSGECTTFSCWLVASSWMDAAVPLIYGVFH